MLNIQTKMIDFRTHTSDVVFLVVARLVLGSLIAFVAIKTGQPTSIDDCGYNKKEEKRKGKQKLFSDDVERGLLEEESDGEEVVEKEKESDIDTFLSQKQRLKHEQEQEERREQSNCYTNTHIHTPTSLTQPYISYLSSKKQSKMEKEHMCECFISLIHCL